MTVKITFRHGVGNDVIVDAATGQSLMQAAVKGGIDVIKAECGGACACGTCHCYIDEEWCGKLNVPSADEEGMLEFVIAPDQRSRLCCQIKITEELDGMIVHLPESQT